MKIRTVTTLGLLMFLSGPAQSGMFSSQWEQTKATFSSLLYAEKAAVIAATSVADGKITYLLKADSGYYQCGVTINQEDCLRLKDPADAGKK